MEWVHRDSLKPNDYNPNKVQPKELKLLKISILEDGWTQPIVKLKDGTIVDGFHRYTVSGHPEIYEHFKGFVPTVTVEIDEAQRKMSTIRHNRARGSHGVIPMAEIVNDLINNKKVPIEEVMKRVQMEREEINRLLEQRSVPEIFGKDHKYSDAWYPEKPTEWKSAEAKKQEKLDNDNKQKRKTKKNTKKK